MGDILTAIQIACIVLLAVGGPVYAVLRLYWRAEAAEYLLRNERLKCSRFEREVDELQEALAEARNRDVAAASSAPDSLPPLDVGEAGTARSPKYY